MTFILPGESVPTRRQQIHIVGAGGTGSCLIAAILKLAKVAQAVEGMPEFDVTVWDPDTVSESNIGRQNFAPGDVGRNKAEVLVNRINISQGLKWRAYPERFQPLRTYHRHFVFGAVDSRAARRVIAAHFNGADDVIWIDCGNSQFSGQVVMGMRSKRKTVLPSVADLFPETVDESADDADDAPSCSVAESIARQDPMVNQTVANLAATLLWQSIRFGQIEAHGGFIDVRTMQQVPMAPTASAWASLGWQQPKEAQTSDIELEEIDA